MTDPTWNDDGTDCTWAAPRWFGVWVDTEDECQPSLHGVERCGFQSDSDTLAAEFQSTTWSGAKATFHALMEWAHDGRCDGCRLFRCECEMIDVPPGSGGY